jgi:hypothetical protein
MIVALLAACLVSVAVFLHAWRGRRVDRHPVCGRCRFDLIALGAEVCPECGLPLRTQRFGFRRRRTIRTGNRQRLHRLAVLAAAASVALAGTATALACEGWSAWEDRKPVWWLLSETRSGSPGRVDGAVRKLLARERAGKLNQGALRLLLDRALAWQADEERPWLPVWGDLVEAAWRSGKLTASQQISYTINAFAPSVVSRRTLRQGDPLPIEITLSPRVGQAAMLAFEAFVDGVALDGQELLRNRVFIGGPLSCAPGVIPPVIPVTPANPSDWPDFPLADREGARVRCELGTHTIKAHLTANLIIPIKPATGNVVWGPLPPGNQPSPYPFIAGSIAKTWDTTIEGLVDVVPTDRETVRLLTDPALAKAVRASISVEIQDREPDPLQEVRARMAANPRFVILDDRPSLDRRIARVTVTNPPVDLAFQGVFRDGRSQRSCCIVARAGTSRTIDIGLGGLAPNTAYQLQLRPSVTAASRTVGITRIWNGELTYGDLKPKAGQVAGTGGTQR